MWTLAHRPDTTQFRELVSDKPAEAALGDAGHRECFGNEGFAPEKITSSQTGDRSKIRDAKAAVLPRKMPVLNRTQAVEMPLVS
ncbi:hypothetical protein PspLS_10337 [Pyricularia sp. CBS 133598]|nr:hypothetical protein PspLS_10337 [Pyricularia sp. CBS 133598]